MSGTLVFVEVTIDETKLDIGLTKDTLCGKGSGKKFCMVIALYERIHIFNLTKWGLLRKPLTVMDVPSYLVAFMFLMSCRVLCTPNVVEYYG